MNIPITQPIDPLPVWQQQVHRFIGECFEPDKNTGIRVTNFVKVYKIWLKSKGEKPHTKLRYFSSLAVIMGLKTIRLKNRHGHPSTVIVGWKLKKEWHIEQD